MTPSETGTRSTKAALSGLASAIALSALMALPAPAADGEPLRICSDPTNLPFSSDDPANPGLYNEIGLEIGKALGRPVTFHWYKSYFGKRTVRETLLSRQCDLMIGLPAIDDFMGPTVIFSKPIASENYAIVAEKGRGLSSVEDLKGLRAAVQYKSTPQNMLALEDDITKVTVKDPGEGLERLASGKADAAFVWGPVAGWLNKTEYDGRFDVVPTEGEGLLWQAAIGFARKDTELRDRVDEILPQLEATIAELSAKYGVPAASAEPAAAEQDKADAAEPSPDEEQTAAAGETAPASDEAALAGRELFNGMCAHCHGPDAVQSDRKVDLRRLHTRYGEKMHDVFRKTVHKGRPAKGMPALEGAFTDEEFDAIFAWLQTVQN